MAQPYVTGAVDIFVKTFEGIFFLGHCEKAPSVECSPSQVPVICDVSGVPPLDVIHGGDGEARISGDLIRFNMTVLNRLRSRGRGPLFPAANAGSDLPGQVGTLLVAEGCAYTVYLRFSHGKRPSMNVAANGVMALGYRFPACVLEPDSFQGGSSSAYKHHVAWKAYRIFDPSASSSYGYGAFLLWDQNLSEVDGLPIN